MRFHCPTCHLRLVRTKIQHGKNSQLLLISTWPCHACLGHGIIFTAVTFERLFSCSNDEVFHHFVLLIKMSYDVVPFISLHLWFVVSVSLSTLLTCALCRNHVLLCWGVQWVFAYLWFGLFVCFCVFFFLKGLFSQGHTRTRTVETQRHIVINMLLWFNTIHVHQYKLSLCFKAFYIRCSLV